MSYSVQDEQAREEWREQDAEARSEGDPVVEKEDEPAFPEEVDLNTALIRALNPTLYWMLEGEDDR